MRTQQIQIQSEDCRGQGQFMIMGTLTGFSVPRDVNRRSGPDTGVLVKCEICGKTEFTGLQQKEDGVSLLGGSWKIADLPYINGYTDPLARSGRSVVCSPACGATAAMLAWDLTN